MAKRKTIIRVRIEKLMSLDAGGEWRGLLDMLRYAGLLRSNVPGFPDVIEYASQGCPDQELARWETFGFQAEAVKE